MPPGNILGGDRKVHDLFGGDRAVRDARQGDGLLPVRAPTAVDDLQEGASGAGRPAGGANELGDLFPGQGPLVLPEFDGVHPEYIALRYLTPQVVC